MPYTAQVPVIPTVASSSMPWVSCASITAFKECPDEVYVRGEVDLWYSRDGGRSFTKVDVGGFSILPARDLVGLAFSNY